MLRKSFKLPLNVSTLADEELAAAKAVIDSGLLTMGDHCRAFERDFATYLGTRNAVMVNSGSSANLLATFALANPLCPRNDGRRQISPGDEIIVPALTWSTTIWPVIQAGCVPVFVDCDPETLQMSPAKIEQAITPKTVAIFIVHVLGGAMDAPAVKQIAERRGLWMLEDTCEALGVLWDSHQAGSFGDVGTFSFYFSHHITTIEGGMVVTDDDELAELMRAMRAHGWTRHMERPERHLKACPDLDPRFLFITTGFNLRPTEINGVIGREQLRKLNGFNDRRREVSAELKGGLRALTERGDLTLMNYHNRCTPAPFGFPVLCRDASTRLRFGSHLEAHGIETRPIICGNMARQPAFGHLPYRISGDLSGADRVMDCGIYWGTHPMMNDDDIRYVLDVINEFFR